MNIWCGDEALAHIYAKSLRDGPNPLARSRDAKLVMASHGSCFEEEDDGWFVLPPIAQVQGNMAIIKVAGGLIPGEAGWRRAYGMLGYEDIKRAFVESASRNDIQGILMYVDSPGGSTNGLKATSEFIKSYSASVKPVVAFAANAASAGYWLASSAQAIVADETATMASIGTVLQLVDYTAANEKEGVRFNIFKSGSLKMAGNPNEELSPEAAALFQGIVDDLTAIFMNAVATNRGMSYEVVKARFGDGRHMLGGRATAMGLADQVGYMSDAVMKLQGLINSRGTNLPRV